MMVFIRIVFSIVLVATLGGMTSPPTVNTIELFGRRLSDLDTRELEIENPSVNGWVTLPEPVTFGETSDGFPVSCCARISIEANGRYFVDEFGRRERRALVHIPEQHPTSGFYRYQAPTIELPTDGSEIELTLRVDNVPVTPPLKAKLKPDLLILPVHFHIFKNPGGNIPRGFTRESVSKWIDFGGVKVQSTTTRDAITGISQTEVWSIPYSNATLPPDYIWSAAGVQFQLESYETISQNDGLERELLNSNETSLPFNGQCGQRTRFWPYHGERLSEAGIHIYVGGRIARQPNDFTVADTLAATCGRQDDGPCFPVIDRDNFIIWHGASQFNQFTLAHELGHYLGLGHPIEAPNFFPCPPGVEVSSGSGNLMLPAGDTPGLTEDQIARARSIACDHLRVWNLPRAGC